MSKRRSHANHHFGKPIDALGAVERRVLDRAEEHWSSRPT